MVNSGQWDFPDFGGGQTHGIDGDSAVSTFKGTALPSLAKEVLQNSLDARKDKSKPAVVKFSVFEIPSSDLPGKDDLYQALLSSKSRNFDERSGNEKIRVFFEKALSTLTAEKISIMQISDFNTTGLTNPDADILDDAESKHSRWLKLVHGMGSTDKGGVSGGSHGQGKSAALANSAIRTLFYSTIDQEGKRAFQGVAYVGTHKKPGGNTLSQSVGYYGNADGNNSPLMECLSLNPSYKRNEAGTDIYVAGFENTEHWIDIILLSVLNDYLVALWKDELVVYIGDDIEISKKTLPDIFDRYRSAYEAIEGNPKDYYADKCLDAIKNPEYHSEAKEVDFYGVHGVIEVFLKTGIGYPKRVSMVRQIGMKVLDKPNQTSAMQYVGVMYIQGDELNAFLAGLENVQHTNWEVDRNSEDSKLAKRRLNALYKYLNDIIRELLERTTSGHMDVDGLEEYFGIDVEDEREEGKAAAVETNNIANITAREIKLKPATEQYSAPSDAGSLQSFGADENEEEEEEEGPSVPPTPKPDPPFPGPIPPAPPEPEPAPPEPQPGSEEKEPRNLSPIVLTKKALLGGRRGSGEYTLILESKEERRIKIDISLSGEETDEKPCVMLASYRETGEEIGRKDNCLYPVCLHANKTTKISFTLSENIPCALGVTVHAY
ncbi:MAG: hypothetical protein II897_01540 [Clostridia bacterium]|nr:hypothetical protein [Clostridia bacterium]